MKTLISALKYCDDKEAFQGIFLQTKDKVYAYFLKKRCSVEDAKDLTQNVYFYLWKYRKQMNEDISLDQHLFQYAKFVYIDHLRTAKKTERLFEDSPSVDDGALVPQFIFNTLDKDQVLHFLRNEPKLNQDIFMLNKWAGYSYQQLSDIFSLPVKSIDNYVNKTMKRLRKKFGI